MIANKPGHIFFVDNYAAKEGDELTDPNQMISFMHRIGDGYPGNYGAPFDGTNCQEILRALISRIKYLDGQEACLDNAMNLQDARAMLFRFERRAASRRRPEYHKTWSDNWFALQVRTPIKIEDVPACRTCGHILCTKHEATT